MGLAARAVLTWLLSQQDNWVTSRDALVAQNEWLTDHQARKALTELEELGILVRTQDYKPGNFGGGVWLIVYPGDSLADEYQPPEGATAGRPLSGGGLSDDGQPLKKIKEEDQKENQLPPTEVESPKVKPSTKGSRIPSPFIVTREMREWAAERVPGIDVDGVTEEFVDWWRAVPGARGVKLDWTATWRTWLRRNHSDPRRLAGNIMARRGTGTNEKTEAWAAFIGPDTSKPRELGR